MAELKFEPLDFFPVPEQAPEHEWKGPEYVDIRIPFRVLSHGGGPDHNGEYYGPEYDLNPEGIKIIDMVFGDDDFDEYSWRGIQSKDPLAQAIYEALGNASEQMLEE